MGCLHISAVVRAWNRKMLLLQKNQICRFYALIDYLKDTKVPIPKLHIQSSYGLLNYPELKCDYVREGISLYGVASTPQDKRLYSLIFVRSSH